MKSEAVAAQYIVIMIIVEFNFKSKFFAVLIMLVILYFGKLEFDKRRALGIFALLLVSQWFPIFIDIFEDIVDALPCASVLKTLQIVIVLSTVCR